jgi:hypothetical protein
VVEGDRIRFFDPPFRRELAACLNQPIAVVTLRSRLREPLALDGFPHLLLRFGYASAARLALRWPLSEVLA